MSFIETSALDSSNVDEAFLNAVTGKSFFKLIFMLSLFGSCYVYFQDAYYIFTKNIPNKLDREPEELVFDKKFEPKRLLLKPDVTREGKKSEKLHCCH
jgi:hypothetical protein